LPLRGRGVQVGQLHRDVHFDGLNA
jgi:hypothetical protein